MIYRSSSRPQRPEETVQYLAVVQADRERSEIQLFKNMIDDRRHLRIVIKRQRLLTDHIDIALVELAETALLRTFAAEDFAHLIPLEGECQIILVLGHITGQGNGQVKPQA